MDASVQDCDAPLRFGAEVAPASVGMSAEGVRRLVALFEGQLSAGLHPGAQLVVVRRGQVVVDRAIGLATTRPPRPVEPSTPFLVFSVTKPLAAICLHKLIEEGKVELDAPIAEYWPEFGQRGKGRATVRHALLHQAGVAAAGMYLQIPDWPHWERVTRRLAARPPEFEPGTQSRYHIVNFGFIVGELVRRVSGRPIERYLAEEFLEPLGMKDSALGLPRAWRGRAAGLYCGHPEARGAAYLFRLPAIRGAVLPAATLHSTARDLAIFYQMLLNEGVYAGRRLLQPETVRRAVALGTEGMDGLIGQYMRWALGFQLGGERPDGAGGARPSGMGFGSTPRTFGHFGNASCMTWADPDGELVITFTCNRLLSAEASGQRWSALSDALWAALDG